MAYLHTNFFSSILCFNTNINVIIPTPGSDEISNEKDLDYFQEGTQFQVLYLLHGAFGDYSDWVRLTGIERYAQEHKLAVVMPSASNSFYQDMYRGSNYYTYLTEELTEFVTSLFPVSTKKEDTFIAGLSMGGYGAVKIALSRPDYYGAAASLSGALDLPKLAGLKQQGLPALSIPWQQIFEASAGIEQTEADLFYLARQKKEQGQVLPPIFQTVGTEDFLYEINQSAKKQFQTIGLDVCYEEHQGSHDWKYWDTHIQRVLEWLPLKNGPV